jgi:hypothetical protein
LFLGMTNFWVEFVVRQRTIRAGEPGQSLAGTDSLRVTIRQLKCWGTGPPDLQTHPHHKCGVKSRPFDYTGGCSKVQEKV